MIMQNKKLCERVVVTNKKYDSTKTCQHLPKGDNYGSPEFNYNERGILITF